MSTLEHEAGILQEIVTHYSGDYRKENTGCALHCGLYTSFEGSACFHISNHPLPFHLHLHEISKFLDSET